MLKPGDIAIVSGARTPLDAIAEKSKDYTAQELGAVAAKAALSGQESMRKISIMPCSATRSRLRATRYMERARCVACGFAIETRR